MFSLLLGRSGYYVKTKKYKKAQFELEKLLAEKENIGDVNLNTNAERQIAEIYVI